MKKSELREDPIDRQSLWWERRSGERNIAAGKSATFRIPVIVKSCFHSNNSGKDEAYLDVAEHGSYRRHTLHLQVLKPMTVAEEEDFTSALQEAS